MEHDALKCASFDFLKITSFNYEDQLQGYPQRLSCVNERLRQEEKAYHHKLDTLRKREDELFIKYKAEKQPVEVAKAKARLNAERERKNLRVQEHELMFWKHRKEEMEKYLMVLLSLNKRYYSELTAPQLTSPDDY